jgi:hypothetical protein
MPDAYTIKPSPGKGLGIFALKDFRPGEVILQDETKMVIYCDRDREPTNDAIAKAFNKLSSEDKSKFMQLHFDSGDDGTKKARIFKQNCFASFDMDSNAHYSRILFIISRANHSCSPNAESTIHDARLIAIKKIRKGEEVLIAYVSPYPGPKALRQATIMKDFGFRCECSICALIGKKSALSDARRQILRVLNMRLSGREPDHHHTTTTSNTFHPLKVSLTARDRVAYSMLCLGLLEAEGITGACRSNNYCMSATALLEQVYEMGPIMVLRSILLVYEWFHQTEQTLLDIRKDDDNAEVKMARETVKMLIPEKLSNLHGQERGKYLIFQFYSTVTS